MSNSNAPSQSTGDIVLIDKTTPFDEYEVGDSVLYTPPGYDFIIIHKIFDKIEVDGQLYFSLKGDSNPQPDAVTGNELIINKELLNQSITWNSFYINETNPMTNFIVSYFPGDQVIHGKVINKIPALGWLFVPFNSPISEPFGLLPISMFSVFVLFLIFINVSSITSLIRVANQELQKFLSHLAFSKTFIRRPVTIKLKSYYQVTIIPLILFFFAMFTITPTPLVIDDQTILTGANSNQDITQLTYNRTVILESFGVSHFNQSQISIHINSSQNLLLVDYTETLNAKSNSVDPLHNFEVSETKSYKLTINKSNMLVNSSDDNSYSEYKKYFNFLIPQSVYSEDNPRGVMTRNIFLKADNGTYNNSPTINTSLNYNFIQELIQVDWTINAGYNRSNGVLLFLNMYETESLFLLPEVLGMVVIWALLALFYELLRKNIQSKFDEKQESILKAQSPPNQGQDTFRLEKYPEMKTYNDLFSSNKTEITEQQKEGKQKLSWEEYRKLEEEE